MTLETSAQHQLKYQGMVAVKNAVYDQLKIVSYGPINFCCGFKQQASSGAPEPVRQVWRTPDQCSRQKVEINAHVHGILIGL